MKIKKKDLIFIKIIIMLIPIFQPKIFTQYNSTKILYAIFNLFEFIYFSIREFYGPINLRGVHWPVIYWIVCQAYGFIVMLITKQMEGIFQYGYLSLMVINFLFVCEYSLRKNITYLLKAISILGTIFLFINYITVLLYPRGIIEPEIYYLADSAQFFLGIKTSFTTMMFPTIASSGTSYLMNKNKTNRRILFLAIIACLINIFQKSISTAIIGMCIIIMLLIIRKVAKINFEFKFLFVFAIILQISIVYFNIQRLFTTFIEDYLHKDVTLSARVNIWKNAKKLISEESIYNFLFGNGTFELHRFVPYGGGRWQPHNQLIVWLYTIGIFGTILMFIFLIKLVKWKIMKNNIFYYLSIINFTIIFLSVNEVYFDVAICYVPFILTYYIGKFYERRFKFNGI